MPTYLKVILAILLLLGLIAIFVVTYLINKKTEAPKGCPKETIGCSGCLLNCGRREKDASLTDIGKNMVEGFNSGKEEKKDDTKEDK